MDEFSRFFQNPIDMSGYPYGLLPQALYDKYGLQFHYTPYTYWNVGNWGILTIRNRWLVITLCETHKCMDGSALFGDDDSPLMYHEALNIAETVFGLEHRYGPKNLRDEIGFELRLGMSPHEVRAIARKLLEEPPSSKTAIPWMARR